MIKEDQNAKFECTALGPNEIVTSVAWKDKDEDPVGAPEKVTLSNTMEITAATVSQTGRYSCTVSFGSPNDTGTITTTVKLDVIGYYNVTLLYVYVRLVRIHYLVSFHSKVCHVQVGHNNGR